MTNLFSDPNSETDEQEINATIETLKTRYAKEDGSFDAEALLKKAAHAERHIRNLEQEAATRSQDNKVSQTLEAILAKIEAKSNAHSEQQSESETPDAPSERVDFDKLIERKLSAYEAQKAQERNRQHVLNELQKLWGSDYLVKLNAKARELGETQEFLDQLAANRPQTFLNLVKDVKTPAPDTFVPPSSVRVPAGTKPGLNTYADFERLRKSDPATYKSKAVQDQLFKLTAEYHAQGKSFTDTK